MTTNTVTTLPSATVRCAIEGCDFEDNHLYNHISEFHRLTTAQYDLLTSGSPMFSEAGRAEFAQLTGAATSATRSRRAPARKAEAPAVASVTAVAAHTSSSVALHVHQRQKKEYGICDTFKIDLGVELSDEVDAKGNPKPLIDPATGKPKKRERFIEGYADKTDFVPAIDPSYVFPVEETKTLLLGLSSRDNVLLVGETGTGKTSLVEQVCARLNRQVVKINFDGHITRQDLIGEWVVKGKDMEFQYGILVHAFRMPGTVVILDEWDTISGECSFVLQRPLQRDDRKILVLEKGGELIPMHEDNVIVATANTTGQGDDTGLYSQGTKVQNYAQLNRFSMTIKMNYLPEDQEVEMIQKRFPKLNKMECTYLVQAINAVRDGYKNGQISAPLSPRDLINWAEKYLRMGDPMRAAKYCFINRMPAEDAQVTEQIIQRVFDAAT